MLSTKELEQNDIILNMEKYKEAPSWFLEFIKQDIKDTNKIKSLIANSAESNGYEKLKFEEIDDNDKLPADMMETERTPKWLFQFMVENVQSKKELIDLIRNKFKHNIAQVTQDLTADEILKILNRDTSLRKKNDTGLAEELHAKLLRQPGPAAPALSGLLDRQWKQQKSVELPAVPSSLRLIDDQLWQCHSRGISVFTLDLEPVRVINCRDMGDIHDVASTGPEEVVVAASKDLYSLNREGNVTNRIAEGWLTSVCHHEDQLYAARDDSHTVSGTDSCTVRVYRRSGSTWTESSRFSVERGYATLSVNSAGVYMCVSEQHKFYHYSHSGELLSSIGSEGSGIDEMDLPCLCSVDSAGTALIADFGNNRLKLLSSGGTWRVIDLQPPVKGPNGALFYNDRLYVNSWSGNSLIMYI